MKKYTLFLLSLFMLIMPVLFLTLGDTPAFAQTQIGGCEPTDTACAAGSDVTGTRLGNMLGKVIQFIFVVAVILALGFLVFGGIKWLTSGGDKEGVASARGTIVAAIIGLIIIFLSYFILNFVLLFLTGAELSSLQIPRIIGGGPAATNVEPVQQ